MKLVALALVLFATQQPIETHIRTLSADAMEGRGLGTKGIGKAADYIERELRAAGAAPAFGKSYRQKFPVKMGVAFGTNNHIDGLKDDEWTPLGLLELGDVLRRRSRSSATASRRRPLNYRELEGSTSRARSR